MLKVGEPGGGSESDINLYIRFASRLNRNLSTVPRLGPVTQALFNIHLIIRDVVNAVGECHGDVTKCFFSN